MLIARLTAQLRCYVPEPADESTATWARLRHLGARRHKLIAETTGQVQEVRDLLECVWPAALVTAAQPFKSQTWAAAMPAPAGQHVPYGVHGCGVRDRCA